MGTTAISTKMNRVTRPTAHPFFFGCGLLSEWSLDPPD